MTTTTAQREDLYPTRGTGDPTTERSHPTEVQDFSPVIDRLSRDPRVLDRARQLLGSEVYLHQTRVNYMENALVEPFRASAPRPNYIANRDVTPLT